MMISAKIAAVNGCARGFGRFFGLLAFGSVAVQTVQAGEGLSYVDSAVLSQAGIGAAALATDKAGVWIAAWVENYSLDSSVRFSRSSDNARTWSAVADLNSDAHTYAPYNVRLATDGAGKWMAIWGKNEVDIRYAISNDNGATWLPEQPLGDRGDQDALAAR